MRTLVLIVITMLNVKQNTAQNHSNINVDSNKYDKILNPIEVKFLYSYYEQDGDHSPVLGGMGSEYLTDHVGKLTVTVPVNESSITFSVGIDHYTSASTDNINPASISSASIVDDRIYFNAGISQKINDWTVGVNAGYSTEWDVTSYSGGFSVSKLFNNENTELSLAYQHYSDKWALIFPVELRRGVPIDSSDWRSIHDGAIVFSQVLSRRAQLALSSGIIIQNGLLATPFHRVYFQDQRFPKTEALPRNRNKIPIGLRLNYYVSDFLIARLYYRYYFDNFDIRASTIDLELPIKTIPFLTLSPFYRFHKQSSSKYFNPIDTHLSSQKFYSSDYDLSAFTSHKIGIGIRYAPVGGILCRNRNNNKTQMATWKKVEGRYATYQRSDGLSAYIFSLSATFNLK